MNLMDAIYRRRAVRAYTNKKVDRDTVNALIDAAVQAPSALNAQPWSFAVIQDKNLLKEFSDRAKAGLLQALDPLSPLYRYRDQLSKPDFNIFYDANTLIVVCAKPDGLNGAEDCCLASQNLMLAAYGMGLATCPIGFARPWLNLPEVKRELGIPADYDPVMPIIVGFSREEPSSPARKKPEIVAWKQDLSGPE